MKGRGSAAGGSVSPPSSRSLSPRQQPFVDPFASGLCRRPMLDVAIVCSDSGVDVASSTRLIKHLMMRPGSSTENQCLSFNSTAAFSITQGVAVSPPLDVPDATTATTSSVAMGKCRRGSESFLEIMKQHARNIMRAKAIRTGTAPAWDAASGTMFEGEEAAAVYEGLLNAAARAPPSPPPQSTPAKEKTGRKGRSASSSRNSITGGEDGGSGRRKSGNRKQSTSGGMPGKSKATGVKSNQLSPCMSASTPGGGFDRSLSPVLEAAERQRIIDTYVPNCELVYLPSVCGGSTTMTEVGRADATLSTFTSSRNAEQRQSTKRYPVLFVYELVNEAELLEKEEAAAATGGAPIDFAAALWRTIIPVLAREYEKKQAAARARSKAQMHSKGRKTKEQQQEQQSPLSMDDGEDDTEFFKELTVIWAMPSARMLRVFCSPRVTLPGMTGTPTATGGAAASGASGSPSATKGGASSSTRALTTAAAAYQGGKTSPTAAAAAAAAPTTTTEQEGAADAYGFNDNEDDILAVRARRGIVPRVVAYLNNHNSADAFGETSSWNSGGGTVASSAHGKRGGGAGGAAAAAIGATGSGSQNGGRKKNGGSAAGGGRAGTGDSTRGGTGGGMGGLAVAAPSNNVKPDFNFYAQDIHLVEEYLYSNDTMMFANGGGAGGAAGTAAGGTSTGTNAQAAAAAAAAAAQSAPTFIDFIEKQRHFAQQRAQLLESQAAYMPPWMRDSPACKRWQKQGYLQLSIGWQQQQQQPGLGAAMEMFAGAGTGVASSNGLTAATAASKNAGGGVYTPGNPPAASVSNSKSRPTHTATASGTPSLRPLTNSTATSAAAVAAAPLSPSPNVTMSISMTPPPNVLASPTTAAAAALGMTPLDLFMLGHLAPLPTLTELATAAQQQKRKGTTSSSGGGGTHGGAQQTSSQQRSAGSGGNNGRSAGRNAATNDQSMGDQSLISSSLQVGGESGGMSSAATTLPLLREADPIWAVARASQKVVLSAGGTLTSSSRGPGNVAAATTAAAAAAAATAAVDAAATVAASITAAGDVLSDGEWLLSCVTRVLPTLDRFVAVIGAYNEWACGRTLIHTTELCPSVDGVWEAALYGCNVGCMKRYKKIKAKKSKALFVDGISAKELRRRAAEVVTCATHVAGAPSCESSNVGTTISAPPHAADGSADPSKGGIFSIPSESGGTAVAAVIAGTNGNEHLDEGDDRFVVYERTKRIGGRTSCFSAINALIAQAVAHLARERPLRLVKPAKRVEGLTSLTATMTIRPGTVATHRGTLADSVFTQTATGRPRSKRGVQKSNTVVAAACNGFTKSDNAMADDASVKRGNHHQQSSGSRNTKKAPLSLSAEAAAAAVTTTRTLFRPYTALLLAARGDNYGTNSVAAHVFRGGSPQASLFSVAAAGASTSPESRPLSRKTSVHDLGKNGASTSAGRGNSPSQKARSRSSSKAGGRKAASNTVAISEAAQAALALAQEREAEQHREREEAAAAVANAAFVIPTNHYATCEDVSSGDAELSEMPTPHQVEVHWLVEQFVRKGLGAFAYAKRGGGSTLTNSNRGSAAAAVQGSSRAACKIFFQAEERARELLGDKLGTHSMTEAHPMVKQLLTSGVESLMMNANDADVVRAVTDKVGPHGSSSPMKGMTSSPDQTCVTSMDILRRSAPLPLLRHEEQLRRTVERSLSRREREHVVQQTLLGELARVAGFVPANSISASFLKGGGSGGGGRGSCSVVELVSHDAAYARIFSFVQRFGTHVATVLRFRDQRIGGVDDGDAALCMSEGVSSAGGAIEGGASDIMAPTVAPTSMQRTSRFAANAENVFPSQRAQELWVAGLSVPPSRRRRLLFTYMVSGALTLEQYTYLSHWLNECDTVNSDTGAAGSGSYESDGGGILDTHTGSAGTQHGGGHDKSSGSKLSIHEEASTGGKTRSSIAGETMPTMMGGTSMMMGSFSGGGASQFTTMGGSFVSNQSITIGGGAASAASAGASLNRALSGISAGSFRMDEMALTTMDAKGDASSPVVARSLSTAQPGAATVTAAATPVSPTTMMADSALPVSVVKQLLTRHLQQSAFYLVPQPALGVVPPSSPSPTATAHQGQAKNSENSAGGGGGGGGNAAAAAATRPVSPRTANSATNASAFATATAAAAANTGSAVSACSPSPIKMDDLQARETLKLLAESRETIFPYCDGVIEVTTTNHSRSCRYTKTTELTATLHYSVRPSGPVENMDQPLQKRSAKSGEKGVRAGRGDEEEEEEEVIHLVVRFDDGVTFTCTQQQQQQQQQQRESKRHEHADKQPHSRKSHALHRRSSKTVSVASHEGDAAANNVAAAAATGTTSGAGDTRKQSGVGKSGSGKGRQSSAGAAVSGSGKGGRSASRKNPKGGTAIAGGGSVNPDALHDNGSLPGAAGEGGKKQQAVQPVPKMFHPHPIGKNGSVRLWSARLGLKDGTESIQTDGKRPAAATNASGGGGGGQMICHVASPGARAAAATAAGGGAATATVVEVLTNKETTQQQYQTSQRNDSNKIKSLDVSVASGNFVLFTQQGSDLLWIRYTGVGGDNSSTGATVFNSLGHAAGARSAALSSPSALPYLSPVHAGNRDAGGARSGSISRCSAGRSGGLTGGSNSSSGEADAFNNVATALPEQIRCVHIYRGATSVVAVSQEYEVRRCVCTKTGGVTRFFRSGCVQRLYPDGTVVTQYPSRGFDERRRGGSNATATICETVVLPSGARFVRTLAPVTATEGHSHHHSQGSDFDFTPSKPNAFAFGTSVVGSAKSVRTWPTDEDVNDHHHHHHHHNNNNRNVKSMSHVVTPANTVSASAAETAAPAKLAHADAATYVELKNLPTTGGVAAAAAAAVTAGSHHSEVGALPAHGPLSVQMSFDATHRCHVVSRQDGVCIAYYYYNYHQQAQQAHYCHSSGDGARASPVPSMDNIYARVTLHSDGTSIVTLAPSVGSANEYAGTQTGEEASKYAHGAGGESSQPPHAALSPHKRPGAGAGTAGPSFVPSCWVSPAIASLLGDVISVSMACGGATVCWCVESPRAPRMFLMPPPPPPSSSHSSETTAHGTLPIVSTSILTHDTSYAGSSSPMPGSRTTPHAVQSNVVQVIDSTGAEASAHVVPPAPSSWPAAFYVVMGDGTVLKRHSFLRETNQGSGGGGSDAVLDMETVLSRSTHTAVRLVHGSGLAIVEPADAMAYNMNNPASLAVGEGFPMFDFALGGLRLVDHRAHVTTVSNLYNAMSVDVDVDTESGLEQLVKKLVRDTYTPHRLPRSQELARDMRRREQEAQEAAARAAGICPPLVQRLRELAESFVIAEGLTKPEIIRPLTALHAAVFGSHRVIPFASNTQTGEEKSRIGGRESREALEGMINGGFVAALQATQPMASTVNGRMTQRGDDAASQGDVDGGANLVAGPTAGRASDDALLLGNTATQRCDASAGEDRFASNHVAATAAAAAASFLADCVAPLCFAKLATGEVVQHVESSALHHVLHMADSVEHDPVFLSRSTASGEPGIEQLTLFRVPENSSRTEKDAVAHHLEGEDGEGEEAEVEGIECGEDELLDSPAGAAAEMLQLQPSSNKGTSGGNSNSKKRPPTSGRGANKQATVRLNSNPDSSSRVGSLNINGYEPAHHNCYAEEAMGLLATAGLGPQGPSQLVSGTTRAASYPVQQKSSMTAADSGVYHYDSNVYDPRWFLFSSCRWLPPSVQPPRRFLKTRIARELRGGTGGGGARSRQPPGPVSLASLPPAGAYELVRLFLQFGAVTPAVRSIVLQSEMRKHEQMTDLGRYAKTMQDAFPPVPDEKEDEQRRLQAILMEIEARQKLEVV